MNNAAGARLAIEQTTKALGIDEEEGQKLLPGELRKKLTNEEKAKAFYRRALAKSLVSDWQSALIDLKLASQSAPEDASIKKEMATTKQKLETDRQKSKARLAKMFA